MINIDDKVIGRHIQAAREKCGLTQAQLAERLDVSSSYMSRIECGRTRINVEKLLEISENLQLSVNDILCDCCTNAIIQPKRANVDPMKVRLQQLGNMASSKTLGLMCLICELLYSKLDC